MRVQFEIIRNLRDAYVSRARDAVAAVAAAQGLRLVEFRVVREDGGDEGDEDPNYVPAYKYHAWFEPVFSPIHTVKITGTVTP